jgi:hypothetical protein
MHTAFHRLIHIALDIILHCAVGFEDGCGSSVLGTLPRHWVVCLCRALSCTPDLLLPKFRRCCALIGPLGYLEAWQMKMTICHPLLPSTPHQPGSVLLGGNATSPAAATQTWFCQQRKVGYASDAASRLRTLCCIIQEAPSQLQLQLQ